MKKAIKEKWVKALVSGKYQQGLHVLMDDCDGTPRYCCLGVLQQVCGLHDNDEEAYLDDKNEAKVQLTREQQRGLAVMNDSGVPFEIIAGFIQENL